MKLLPFGGVLALGALFAALGGCAHITYSSPPMTPTPTPTPTPSTAPSSAPCRSANPGAQIIAITPQITATLDPAYGLINGYDLVQNYNVSNVAAVVALLPADTVQFFNNDASTSDLRYSAVGIPQVTAFPNPLTFIFPVAAAQPIGAQINSGTSWSTGLLAGQCYSQVFTIAAKGTYYFGDYTYYSLANIRDVLLVSTSAPQSRIRR
jgi:hypothetical protein